MTAFVHSRVLKTEILYPLIMVAAQLCLGMIKPPFFHKQPYLPTHFPGLAENLKLHGTDPFWVGRQKPAIDVHLVASPLHSSEFARSRK